MAATLAKSDLTLAILAGGRGRRLGGVAKGLLTVGGVALIDRALGLRALCADAMIVSADPAYEAAGVRRVADLVPGHGAPGGVVTALLCASTPWVLVVACDMPFVTLEAARALLEVGGRQSVTCFTRGGALEPLLGIYAASLGPRWRAQLPVNPALRALVAQTSPHTLEPSNARWLDSINTPAQLAAVKS